MPHSRVKQYVATTHYPATGETRTELRSFTQAQADEAGTVLELDGIGILAARKLCNLWTKRGAHSDVVYTYRIPFCKDLP